MRSAIISLAIAMACIGSVIADTSNIVDVGTCAPYVFTDPTQFDFNEGSAYWDTYTNLEPTEDKKGDRHVTDQEVKVPYWHKWWRPSVYYYYDYKLNIDYKAQAGGQYNMSIELISDKGLGQQWIIGFKDIHKKFLAINWLMPDQACSADQSFNAKDINEVQFFTRSNF